MAEVSRRIRRWLADRLSDGPVAEPRTPDDPIGAVLKDRSYAHLLDRLAGSSHEIVYLYDAENLHFHYINDAIEAALGYPAVEVTAHGPGFMSRRLHPDDRETFAAHQRGILELREGEVAEVEIRLQHVDESWRSLRMRNRVLARTPDGRLRTLLGTATDITDYTRAREALRISEERYRIVSDLTSDYAFSVRIDADGSLTREWITEAFGRITGYEPEELSESMWEQLVHPDDHEVRRGQFLEAVQKGQLIHEYRIIRKTGEVRWIREHARVLHSDDGSLHWYGACQDITGRKLAEEAQSLAQERFEAITQSARDIIAEFDGRGRMLYVSPNVLELTGIDPDFIIRHPREDVLHPDDAHMVSERILKAMETGESESLIFRMQHRDGDWHWMDATVTAFRSSEGDVHALMICRDITDRLKIEDERQRLVSVVENSSEFIAMMMLDGRILFLNDAGHSLIGVQGKLRARSVAIFDCLAAEDAQDMRFKVLPAVNRSGRWEGELKLRHLKTGVRITTLAHVFQVSKPPRGGSGMLAIVARDISDRITAEMLLRESEARHRMLVESAYDLIAEFDSEGRFAYASPNFQSQLGYGPEELIGWRWIDLVHREDRQQAAEAISEPSRSECPPVRLRHRNGDWCWVETNLRQYDSIGGQPIVLAFLRDITRRKQAEEALRQSQEQLLHSQKMEAIGRLAGGIAHDFNNLLTAITGYGDLLLEEINKADHLRGDVEEIIRAAERAAALTSQLLAFSRRQVLLTKVLDLNALVADVERLLRRLIGEDIEITTRLTASRPYVRLDPGQLEQLVINLAVNARDAMTQGGRLTIATSNLRVSEAGDPRHPGIVPAEYVVLTVRDTGIGMDPQTVSKVFEPFFTTKDPGKGTGLGLATVYGIIRQSGGDIRVESEPDVGSTFIVYLPRTDEAPTYHPATPRAGELRGDETVLLVEDSDTVRRLVKRTLERHGYTVLDASSGVDALRIAEEHDGEIALLLTDVVLPRMDGHELAQNLMVFRPEVKVIYMSGFSADTLAQHGVDAADIVLVKKPFAPSELLRELRRRLGPVGAAD